MWLPGAGGGGEDLTAKNLAQKKRIHHRGTESAEFGVFLDENVFLSALRGEFSSWR